MTKDNGFAFYVFAGTFKGSNNVFSTAVVKTDSAGRVPCDDRDFTLPLKPYTLISKTDVTTNTFTLVAENYTPQLINAVIHDSVVCREINDPNGISQYKPGVQIEIFPNPTTGLFNLNIASPEANTRLEIYNCLGSIVYESNMKQHLTIDLGDFPSGIYFAKLSNGSGVLGTKKIIKE